MYTSKFKEENKFTGSSSDIQLDKVQRIFKSEKDIKNWAKKNPDKWERLQSLVVRSFGRKYPFGITEKELWDANPLMRRDFKGNITVQDFN